MRIIREINDVLRCVAIRYYYAHNELKLHESKFEIATETVDGVNLSRLNNADHDHNYKTFVSFREMEVAVVSCCDIGEGIIEAYIYGKQNIDALRHLLVRGIIDKCNNVKFKCETCAGLIESLFYSKVAESESAINVQNKEKGEVKCQKKKRKS